MMADFTESNKSEGKELIEQGITALFEPGDIVEVRVVKAGKNGTISGYFSDFGLLADAVASLSGRHPGVYYTLNPVKPSLVARANNRVKTHARETTADADIVKRNWILVDLDPVRPAGISSTDAELEMSKSKARQVFKYLRDLGWADPLVAMSGNGTHLVYKVDLPNDPAATELVKSVLSTLAEKFDDDAVKVDKSVHNAARIGKSYGSLACKGDSTADRPHRLARVLTTSQGLVTVEQLQALADLVPAPEPRAPHTQQSGQPLKPEQVQDFLESQEVEYKECVQVRPGQMKWVLDACPFNPEHVNKDAAVFLTDGMLGFKCLHNSCTDNHWKEFRAKVQEQSGKKFQFSEGNGGGTVLVGPGTRVLQTPAIGQTRRTFDTIEPQKQEWLWDGKVPLGAVTIFAGDPSLGKTLLLLDFAARGSRGKDFIDGTPNTEGKFGTMLMSAEDDTSRILIPRLIGMHADLSKFATIEEINDTKNGQPVKRPLRLDRDLHALREQLRPLADGTPIKLVVIDPLSNYAGSANINSEQEIRAILMPLNSLAQELGISIVTVMHNSKTSGRSAMHKVIGAVGIAGVTRMGWSFIKDPDESGNKLMLQMKENLGKFPGIRYNTQNVEVALPDGQQVGVAGVKYLGTSEMSVQYIIAQNEDARGKSDQPARAFLKKHMEPGVPASKVELFLNADAQGINGEALKRAQKSLGILETQQGRDYVWVYPELLVGTEG